MARVPLSVLRDRVEYEAPLGHTATGPAYADAITVRCRWEWKRRAVRTSAGEGRGAASVRHATAVFACRPDSRIVLEGRIVRDGVTYEVLDIATGDGLASSTHLEVSVG